MTRFVFFDISSQRGIIYADRKMVSDRLKISNSTLKRRLAAGPYWGEGFVVFRAVEISSKRGKKEKT